VGQSHAVFLLLHDQVYGLTRQPHDHPELRARAWFDHLGRKYGGRNKGYVGARLQTAVSAPTMLTRSHSTLVQRLEFDICVAYVGDQF
jgi:hypothetical protein